MPFHTMTELPMGEERWVGPAYSLAQAYRSAEAAAIEAGSHGVIAAGSTDEFFLMSDQERARVFALAVEAADGRVPVFSLKLRVSRIVMVFSIAC